MDKAPSLNRCVSPAASTKAKRLRSRGVNKASERVTCDICEKSFANAGSLKQHWPVHTGEKAYTCCKCDKSFTFYSNLYDHMSVHDDDPLRWQCPFCEKRCRLKGNLFIHFKTHFADVEQRMQAWKESFPAFRTPAQSTHLSTSVPFTCKICKKSFALRSDLRNHLSVHAEHVSKWQCAHCGKQFRLIGHLRQHFKVHRKNVQERANASKKGLPVESGRLNPAKTAMAPRGSKPVVRSGMSVRGQQQARSRFDPSKRPIKLERPKPRSLNRADARANVGTFVCTLCNQKFANNWNLRRHSQKCLAKKLRSLKVAPRCSTPTGCVKPAPDTPELDNSPAVFGMSGNEIDEGKKTGEQDYSEQFVLKGDLSDDATIPQAMMGSKSADSDAPEFERTVLACVTSSSVSGTAACVLMNIDVAGSGRKKVSDGQLQAAQESRLRGDWSTMEMDTSSSSEALTPEPQPRESSATVGTSDLQAARGAQVTSIRYRRLDGTLLETETDAERLLTFGDFRAMFKLPEGAKVSFKKLNSGKYRRSALWLTYDKDKDYMLVPLVDGRDTIEAEDCE